MGNDTKTDFNEIIAFLAELKSKLKIVEKFTLDE